MSHLRGNGIAYGRDSYPKEIKTMADAIDMLNLCVERMENYDDSYRLIDRMEEVDIVREYLENLVCK
jgi:hypothetical protein